MDGIKNSASSGMPLKPLPPQPTMPYSDHSHRFIFIAIAEIHDITRLKRGVKGRHEKTPSANFRRYDRTLRWKSQRIGWATDFLYVFKSIP
jgi:hypothetical protein